MSEPLEFDRQELADTLEKVKPALAVRGFIPVMQCFCFTKGAVCAYNDAIGVVAPFQADLECAVSSHALDVVKTMAAKTVKVVKEDGAVRISAGRSRFKVPTMPPDSFLFDPPADESELPDTGVVVAVSNRLVGGVGLCAKVFEEDVSVPVQRGIIMECSGGRLYLYSSDNVTASRYHVGRLDSDDFQAVLSKSFCDSLMSLRKTEGAARMVVGDDSVWCAFESGTILYGKHAPDVDTGPLRELFRDRPAEMHEIPASLRSAAERSAIVARTGKHDWTSLAPDGKGNLKVRTSTESAGDVSDTVKIGAPAEEVRVRPEHLSRAVGLCDRIGYSGRAVWFSKGKAFKHLLSLAGD